MTARPFSQDREDLTVVVSLTARCNYGCLHCFATYDDIDGPKRVTLMPDDDLAELVCLLARRFAKVTFAGGEPTLYRDLPRLVAIAKNEGALTDVVTNATRVTNAWLDSMSGQLDFLTLSVDSIYVGTNRAIGRSTAKGETLTPDDFMDITESARTRSIGVKVNTVVGPYNKDEDLSAFIAAINPVRWKIIEVTPVEGQNDKAAPLLTRDRAGFDAYVERHQTLNDTGVTRIETMPIETLLGSYVTVGPTGTFIDNASGTYRYSDPILKVGIDAAHAQVTFDHDKYVARGGDADLRQAVA